MTNQSQHPESDLSAAIDQLFTSDSPLYQLKSGERVRFKRAGIVQLGKLSTLFQTLMDKVDPAQINRFLELIAMEQSRLIQNGESAHSLNMNTVAAELLEKALGNQSLLLTIFAACAEQLPVAVELFSDISAEKYADLELDEQLILAAGVIAANYGFFTQSLPHIIKNVFAGLQRRKQEHATKVGKLENTAAK